MARDLTLAAIVLLGLGLLIGGVALVMPWWSFGFSGFGAQVETTASPFDPGQAEGDSVDGTAVTVTGVLAALSLAAGLADLVLRGRALQRDAWPPRIAAWLSIGGGVLLIGATLAAVWTWPVGELGFWSSAGNGFGGYRTSAQGGWYLALAAGACLVAGGFLGSTDTAPWLGTVEVEYAG